MTTSVSLATTHPAVHYLGVLYRRRRFIARTVLFSTILVAGYSLIMPKTFKSEAVIVPTKDASTMSVLDAVSGGLLGMGLGRGTTEILLLKALLESRTLRDNIVRQFNLQEVYQAPNLDEAVITLSGKITVTLTADNTLRVAFRHATGYFSFNEDKELVIRSFVRDVAQGIILQLDSLNRKTQGVEARNYREFIEQRRATTEGELAELEDSLARFQTIHHVTVVDQQIQATYQAAAILEAELIKQELEFAITKAKLGINNPIVASLREGLDAAGKAFERSFGGRGTEKRYMLGYDRNLPDLMKEYLRLVRDIKIQTEIFAFITSKFEESRLREAQDIPTINILDYPAVPEIRAAPHRSVLVITAGVLMTILAVLLSFVLEAIDRVRLEHPEQFQALRGSDVKVSVQTKRRE
ncbi:MAG: hypothetical protein IIA60_08560 [Candidatus Marinimicrobia bacterium]|nr:hypothetical protein [Candidatus Neomarinimicrobiota bacterium]